MNYPRPQPFYPDTFRKTVDLHIFPIGQPKPMLDYHNLSLDHFSLTIDHLNESLDFQIRSLDVHNLIVDDLMRTLD